MSGTCIGEGARNVRYMYRREGQKCQVHVLETSQEHTLIKINFHLLGLNFAWFMKTGLRIMKFLPSMSICCIYILH